ncbi:MAG: DUF4271 domain-containing protein [Phocaeicola sp.]
MNESCRKDLTYLFNLEAERHSEIEAALTAKAGAITVQQEGILPIARPYLLRSDGVVACFFLLCLIVLSYVFSHAKNYLFQQVRSFFVSKARGGLFDTFTASDARYRFALLFHTCVLLGFCAYNYLSDHESLLFLLYPQLGLLGLFIGAFVFLLLFKSLLFQVVNTVFFDKIASKVWLDSFLNVLVGMGFLLSPVILLVVYFGLPSSNAIHCSLFVVLISKIILFYKCKTTFFDRFHRTLHLILYFCALEIVPDLLFWKGIVLMNTSLVLNF